MFKLQAAAWAAEQRAQDQEACGCDDEAGTNVAYDDKRGEIVVLDDSDEEGPSASHAIAGSGGPQQPSRADHQAAGAGEGLHVLASSRGLNARLGATEGSRLAEGLPRAEGDSFGGDCIDLTLSEDEGEVLVPAKKATSQGTGRRNQGRKTLSPWEWTCPTCTYKNGPFAPACDMCSTPKPLSSTETLTRW